MSVLLIVAACATQKEEKVEASSEVIYEEEPLDAGPVDPFAGCQGQLQQGATRLSCGNLTGFYIEIPALLSEQVVEQNFQQFEAGLPTQAKRERFTQQFGEHTATGTRASGEGANGPFRAEMIFVPVGEKRTKMVSCAIAGTTDYSRCEKVTEQLVTSGVPEGIEGLPPPAPPAEETDGGVPEGDGGMGMEEGADAGAAPTGADAGVAPTRPTGKKKKSTGATP